MIFLAAPEGHLVANNGNGNVSVDARGPLVIRVPGKDIQVPMPMPMPADQGIVVDPGVAVDDEGAVVAGPALGSINFFADAAAQPLSGTQP
jgi:hypothetical protein